MNVLVIERYREYIRVTQRDRLARGRCQVKNRVSARRETSLIGYRGRTQAVCVSVSVWGVVM